MVAFEIGPAQIFSRIYCRVDRRVFRHFDMRLTFPNPLGPPITLDTSLVSSIPSQLANAIPMPAALAGLSGRTAGRKGPIRLLTGLVLLLLLVTYRPTPPFPPTYSREWALERQVQWAKGGEGLEGGEERLVMWVIYTRCAG